MVVQWISKFRCKHFIPPKCDRMIVIFDPLDLKVSALDEVRSEFCEPMASDET